ncbi:MAG: glycosyltransferase family 4 protein [Candidatus Aphodosoma sp.]
MRVLWFSPTPSLYSSYSNSHNGGGWISSLEQIVRSVNDISLGVAFKLNGQKPKNTIDDVTYYCIDSKSNGVQNYIEIIDDFKPDIIQIFGSENEFGDICSHIDIPVVIHMQGCLPPYHNALFPVGMNKFDFLIGRGLTLRRRFMGWRSEPSFRRRAEHEINTIRSCKFFMGRTDWDKALVSLFNPKAKYFHCEEALRDSFLNMDKHWAPSSQDKIKIISVISNPWYKGVDLILKTAKLLKQFTSMNFEWNVFGVSDIRFYEYKYGIFANNVNVNIRGSVGKEVLVNELCNSSVYVHPSYIDNSPNSVCEAQLIGIPVLATNVGGISSLVKDGETGFLFPANDPYMLANLIKMVVNDRALSVKLCASEISVAKARHNPDSIKTTLLNVYNYILNEK